MKIEKIYETASDLHVAGQFGYVKTSSDTFVYADKEFKNKLDKEVCKNMFLMGNGILVQDGNYYKIVSAKIQESEVSLSYVKDGSTVETVYSKEHAA